MSAVDAGDGFVKISQQEYEQLLKRAIRVENKSGAVEGMPQNLAASYGGEGKFKTTATRMMELPVEEEVRVPVEKKEARYHTEKKVVTGMKLVPVKKYKDVEETSVEIKEEVVHGYRTVWKPVKEPYSQVVKRPVTVTTTKKVPYTDYEERPVSMVVNVPCDTLQTKQGVRVDKVLKGRMVEVEQDEFYEMVPSRVGLGDVRIKNDHGEESFGRTLIGPEIYGDDSSALQAAVAARDLSPGGRSVRSTASYASQGSVRSHRSNRSNRSARPASAISAMAEANAMTADEFLAKLQEQQAASGVVIPTGRGASRGCARPAAPAKPWVP